LKNQINPHFLYNALSLLYSKTLPLSDEVATLVGKISEILRYSLDEPVDESGLVPITKEIAHIQNYIDIQSLRFSNKMNVNFEIKGDVSQVKIAPMLLITFVENSFKHGYLKAPIRFVLNVENGIEFVTENSIGTINKDASSGIGLENVTKRLELVYPHKHFLKVSQSENIYRIHLKIAA
jgi:LytS/YehU family sensor histidine kinase